MHFRRNRSQQRRVFDLGSHAGSLSLIAFSDYRIQDLGLLIEKIANLDPPPDLILYAGDDIERFRQSGSKNLFQKLASISRYGLCAVVGNDEKPFVRNLVSGRRVYNVHRHPAKLGDFAILGLEGAPYRHGLSGIGYVLHSEVEIAKHLSSQRKIASAKRYVVLSHAPPEGVLDLALRFSIDGKPRPIGSRALRNFIKKHKKIALVVSGHVHRCGGMHKKIYQTVVVNAANHDDFGSVARFARIKLGLISPPEVEWHQIREASIVPGIGPTSVEALRMKGIRTVEELAASPIELLRSMLRFGHPPAVLKARAQALVENRAIVIQPLKLPITARIYLDIETDLNQDYIWLIGVWREGAEKCQQFFAESPTDERRILSAFLEFIDGYPDANLLSCSGSRFEERIIRKQLITHGLHTLVCDRIIDLYQTIVHSVAIPVESCRVKDIGNFFGYRYKHPDLDGFTIASEYAMQYQQMKNSAKRKKLALKFSEYNEDDVRCLPFIIDSVNELFQKSTDTQKFAQGELLVSDVSGGKVIYD